MCVCGGGGGGGREGGGRLVQCQLNRWQVDCFGPSSFCVGVWVCGGGGCSGPHDLVQCQLTG